MDTTAVKLIYFSPTGTTRSVLEGIAAGMPDARAEHYDLTLPAAMAGLPEQVDGPLAIIGAPVYAGRIPAQAVERLRQFRGNGTPAAVVVVYGNRHYDDALLELRDLATEQGFVPIAAGAFVGEHSYSNTTTPIAVGRPDAADLEAARAFGERIGGKLRQYEQAVAAPELAVPGNTPYKQGIGKLLAPPSTKAALCTTCKACEKVCPTGAITVADSVTTEAEGCIACCACIRACPTGSRVMEHERVLGSAKRLHANCSERREPELFV